MNILSNRKKFVESRYAPEDTNVLWVSKSGNEIEDIKQFINGQWVSILSESSGGGENPVINRLVEECGYKGSNFQVVSVDSNTDTIVKVQTINESNNVWYQSKSENIKTYMCPYDIVYNVGDGWSSEELNPRKGTIRMVQIENTADPLYGILCVEESASPVLLASSTEDIEETIELLKVFYTDITKGTQIEFILTE